MKLKSLILTMIFFNQISTSWASNVTPKAIESVVSVGQGFACAVDDEGVKCWGDSGKVPRGMPVFENPTQVVSGNDFACAIDGEKLKCWGNSCVSSDKRGCWGYDSGTPWEVKLNNPRQLAAGEDSVCALDDRGVICFWYSGNTVALHTEVLHPIQVSLGENFCVLDAEGMKCFNMGIGWHNMDHLKNPVYISRGYGHYCVIDSEGIKCWDYNVLTKGPKLDNPTQVSPGHLFWCALDAQGVTCWGKIDKVPSLRGPQQISAGLSEACARTEDGVQCWGGPNFSPYTANLLFVSLKSLRDSFSQSRANYVDPLFQLQRKQQYSSLGNSIENYFLLALVSPAVLSVDSEFYSKRMIPAYGRFMDKLGRSFGYVSISDGLSKISDSEANRVMALESACSALSVAKNFVSANHDQKLQELIRTCGSALALPMDNLKIMDLVKQVDAFSAEKQNLKLSAKSAFLVDSLELAANWLREKVK